MSWIRRVETRLGGREGRGVVILRAGMVLLAIAVAYHNSLLSLIRNVAADTPLAYLGLVPFIALGLVYIQTRRRQWQPDIHDRYLDYIVGLPLIIGALGVLLAGPVLLSTFFWSWRLDLLTLPLFAAGAITLVFGLRTTARLKLPIAFLLLAWPLPYAIVLGDWVRLYGDATVSTMRSLMGVIPVALPIEGLDGSLFQIRSANEVFVVSVGSACAGVNGAVGFLLVGSALAGVVRGRLIAKLGWLITGMLVTWALNIVRILLIFVAGATQGQEFAIDALHPYVGLLTFNLGMLAMLLVMPLFDLTLRPAGAGPTIPPQKPTGSAPVTFARPARPLAVRRSAVALAVVVMAAVLAGSANADRDHELLIADMGQPRLGAFTPALAPVGGWTASLTNSYPWVRQYFGDGSRWNRYTYLSDTTPAVGSPPVYVTVDVISTLDLHTFSTYGLEACYGFHNYRLLDTERSDVGAGVVAKSIVYHNPSTKTNWTAVYWEWPIQTAGGQEYERIILNASSAGSVVMPPAQASTDPIVAIQFTLASLLGDAPGELSDPALIATRDLLLGFGRAMVNSRAQAPTVSAVR